MSHEIPALTKRSLENSPQITLGRDELLTLLEQAAARGAAMALQRQRPCEMFFNLEAAAYVYGRPDKIEAWRQLRIAYPELDAASTGTGAGRHWTREALDSFLAKYPQFRRRAQKVA